MRRPLLVVALLTFPVLGCSSSASETAADAGTHEDAAHDATARDAPREATVTDADKPLVFPKGFEWSVSISAEESEGANLTNDWHAFEDMGRIPPAGMAQDFYHLYDTDFTNAESIHLTSFQMTIEWARIVPKMPADPTHLTAADIDATEVAHYHAVLADMAAHHMMPIITLTHYSLPIWVDNPAAYDSTTNTFTDGSLGGWTNPATGAAMAGYASFLATEFGAQVSWWLTEDEPEDDMLCGYMTGTFPPGLNDLSLTNKSLPNDASATDVMQNMIAGHALAYRAIHAVQPDAHVSFAHNSLVFVPLHGDATTAAALTRIEHLYNDVFLDALTTGEFDSGLVGEGPMVSHPEWAHSLDFIGVNYYDTNYVVSAPGFLPPLNAIPCNSNLPTFVLHAYGCPAENPPEIPGMTKILVDYAKRYDLPLTVTESGTIASPERKAIFLVQVLKAVHDAIDQGANVLGYSFWTLNYDYEWNDGYTQDMGLYDIKGYFGPDGGLPTDDGGVWAPGPGTDQTRVPLHPVIDVYRTIAGGNAIPGSLLAKYATDGGEWY